MSGQSGTACERLGTALIRTLEWFLARVNPFMLVQFPASCAHLGTVLMGTLEWFLACVNPFMYR